ncbi:hypothetical protein K2173_019596 [Erythroxylum novogranatense]|uniref:Pentatricopeptide repeat-containing protein n=1 Tax=Erythroxylum novogranatense TaxID=1862640 RepID=A0AAV8UED0_9ROSI|nr:hypothetical protein K2173_019596 [Erythroxylum novogranatense]
MMSNSFNATLLHRALRDFVISPSALDYALYGRLFQCFGELRLPLQGKQLHARLVVYSETPSNFLASKVINFYARTNGISEARRVFDDIHQKNTFAYNAMLLAYALNSCPRDALIMFSSLACSAADVRPDRYSVTCLLKSLSDSLIGDGSLVKEVHGFVLRNELDADVFVGNALVSYYSKYDKVDLARKVFDRMSERDVVTWNSMISGYSQGGFYEECKGLYREMVDSSGFMPDVVAVICVLQACGQSKDLTFGMEVHKYVIENQIKIDVSFCNALIGFYAKCGSLEYARELLDKMPEKDDVTYSAIISGYMVHGFVQKGLELFKEMESPRLNVWNAVISGLVQNNSHESALDLGRQMQTFGLRPNTVTLSSILCALSKFSNLKVGKETHCYAVKNSYDRNIYVATAIIDAYGKSGFLSGAQRIFDRSKGRSLIIWTAIVSAYAAHGDAKSALSLFDKMLISGIQPDPVIFTAVLTACAYCGMVDKAWEIFDSIKNYGIQPTMEHYACMVGVLSKAERLSDATEFVRKMPIEPSAKVWGALLNGASVASNVELGEFVCEHLFQIEPENTGNYIIMANLYSEAGRWKQADEVREKMNQVGLRKIPGSSWIETSKECHNFAT